MHSGEMHDSLELLNFGEASEEDRLPHDFTRSKRRAYMQSGLAHSGELHESFEYMEEEEEVNVDRKRKTSKERNQSLDHSGEMHDTIDIMISSEELSQGQVYVIIVSCLHQVQIILLLFVVSKYAVISFHT